MSVIHKITISYPPSLKWLVTPPPPMLKIRKSPYNYKQRHPQNSLHFAITNHKSIIPVTLDNDYNLYVSWSALFKVQAHVYNVLDHIISPIDELERQKMTTTKSNDG